MRNLHRLRYKNVSMCILFISSRFISKFPRKKNNFKSAPVYVRYILYKSHVFNREEQADVHQLHKGQQRVCEEKIFAGSKELVKLSKSYFWRENVLLSDVSRIHVCFKVSFSNI